MMAFATDDLVTRKRLTAPHYLAYSWVLSNIPKGSDTALDFGSRYSILPSILHLNGLEVTAFDRDPLIAAHQDRAASLCGFDEREWAAVHDEAPDDTPIKLGTFSLVTACWAIQHNLPIERLSRVAYRIAALVRSGGSLLVVSSFSPGQTRTDEQRVDPQIVMNAADHMRYVQAPLERRLAMRIAKMEYFWYEHASEAGEFCEPDQANAVCYRMVRP